MENQITIKYPGKMPDAMHLSRKQFEQEAKIAMAVKLFEMKKISSGMAAEIAGMDRVSFLLTLSQYGVGMINYDEDELESDMYNA
jgi:predicted HTH domain antitoxin